MHARFSHGSWSALTAALSSLLIIILLAACDSDQPLLGGQNANATINAERTALNAEINTLEAENEALLAASGAFVPQSTPPPALPFSLDAPETEQSAPPMLGGPATIVSGNPFLPPPPTPRPPAIAMLLTPTRDPNMPTFDPNRRNTAIVATATAQELDRRVRMTATALAQPFITLTGMPDPQNQTATAVAATIIASSATPPPLTFRVELAADPTFTEVVECDTQVIRGTISGELDRELLVRVVGEGIDRVRVTDGPAWEIPVADEPTAGTYTVTVRTLQNQPASGPIEVTFDGTCEAAAALTLITRTLDPNEAALFFELASGPVVLPYVGTAVNCETQAIIVAIRSIDITAPDGLPAGIIQVRVIGPDATFTQPLDLMRLPLELVVADEPIAATYFIQFETALGEPLSALTEVSFPGNCDGNLANLGYTVLRRAEIERLPFTTLYAPQLMANSTEAACDTQIIQGDLVSMGAQIIISEQLRVRVTGDGQEWFAPVDGTGAPQQIPGWAVEVADAPTQATYTVQVETSDGIILSAPVEVVFPGECGLNMAQVTFQQINAIPLPMVPHDTPTPIRTSAPSPSP